MICHVARHIVELFLTDAQSLVELSVPGKLTHATRRLASLEEKAGDCRSHKDVFRDDIQLRGQSAEELTWLTWLEKLERVFLPGRIVQGLGSKSGQAIV